MRDFVKEIHGMKKEDANNHITKLLNMVDKGVPLKDIPIPSSTVDKPTTVLSLQKGDIVVCHTLGSHPAIILSSNEAKCSVVILTTEPTCPSILCPIENSRVLSGFFTSTVTEFNTKDLAKTFKCPFDNPKQLKTVRKLLKERIKTLLK